MDMQKLGEYAAEYKIELTGKMLDDFALYADMLVEWNEKVNLTAITDPEGVIIKHFLDSILGLQYIKNTCSLIDVGTGAGFPGIPIKIVRPDVDLTLLDSLNKRVTFLAAVSERLRQNNNCVHSRAEDAAKKTGHREKYNIVTARAVSAFPVLCEYCLPFVKQGGAFLAYKGPEVEPELLLGRSAVKKLGGKIEKTAIFELPMNNTRSVVVVKKISQTPAKYPRNQAQITKTPL